MPQPDNQRQRGAQTQRPTGNTVAPSGVSGEFNKGGAAEAAAIASIVGQSPTQIKIGQQGRIIDDGTGLYQALQGASQGAVQGLEQYEKMRRYTSQKAFNDWDTERLAYAGTVNNDPRQMAAWLSNNKFKPNDVNAKDYYTVVASTNQKSYDQYEIDRYNELSTRVATLSNEDAQGILSDALRQTDATSPIYTRLSERVNGLNQKLVDAGIKTRVAQQTIRANNDLFTIGEKLRAINVQPSELTSERGQLIATAVAYFGNNSIDGAGPGIAIDEAGNISYKTREGGTVTGSFNGGLDDGLATAIRDDLGSMVDANNTEQFAMISSAFDASWHRQHTSDPGRGGPQSRAAQKEVKLTPVMNALEAQLGPEAVTKAIYDALPAPLGLEAFADDTTQEEVDAENRKLFTTGYDEIVSRIENLAPRRGESNLAFQQRRMLIAANMELVGGNEDAVGLQQHYGFGEEDDPYLLRSGGAAKLREVKQEAAKEFIAEAGADTDRRINLQGYTPAIRRQILAESERDLVTKLTTAGINFTVRAPRITVDEEGKGTLDYVTLEATDTKSLETVMAESGAEQHVLVVNMPMGPGAQKPTLIAGTTGTSVILAGHNEKQNMRMLLDQMRVQQKAQRNRNRAEATFAGLANPETAVPSDGNITQAVEWYMEAATSSNNPTAAAFETLKLAAPEGNRQGTTHARRVAVRAISGNPAFTKLVSDQFATLAVSTAGTLIGLSDSEAESFIGLASMASLMASGGDPSLTGIIIDSTTKADTIESVYAGRTQGMRAEAATVRLMHESVYAVTHMDTIAERILPAEKFTEFQQLDTVGKFGMLRENGQLPMFASMAAQLHSDYVQRTHTTAALSDQKTTSALTNLGLDVLGQRGGGGYSTAIEENQILAVLRNQPGVDAEMLNMGYPLARSAFDTRFAEAKFPPVKGAKEIQGATKFENALLNMYGDSVRDQALNILLDAVAVTEGNVLPGDRASDLNSIMTPDMQATVSPLLVPVMPIEGQPMLPELFRDAKPGEVTNSAKQIAMFGGGKMDVEKHPVLNERNFNTLWSIITGGDRQYAGITAAIQDRMVIKVGESTIDGSYAHIGFMEGTDFEALADELLGADGWFIDTDPVGGEGRGLHQLLGKDRDKLRTFLIERLPYLRLVRRRPGGTNAK